MEITSSNKGDLKALFSGHMYTIKYKGIKKISWRCVKSSVLKCPGILQSELDYSEPHVIKTHLMTCIKNTEKINVTKYVNEMIQLAVHSEKKPGQIFSEVVAKVDHNTKALMPAEDTVKRRLRRQKSKTNPINPNYLSELVIEDEWCYLGDKSTRFLLHDNGTDKTERIIIFATDNGLKYLTEASTWYMDGNFSMAPVIFHQLYVIRVKINSVFITAAFILLKNKTESSYENMFQIIMHKCAEKNLFPDPQIINVDFEKAVINSIKTVIGEDVQIQGCFFHLCQSTHRKIQQLGLEQLYRSNEEFSHFCGMLDSLAFLPINDIDTGLSYLKSVMPEEATDLVEYFERTYIGSYKRVGNGQSETRIKLRKTSPHFPPSVWNVNAATLNNGDRTNNVCEGWNNRFSNLVNHKHPTIWTLITKMRHENAADETKVAQRQLGTIGPPTKKNKKYLLKNICEEYNDKTRDIPNFLNAIANFIRQ